MAGALLPRSGGGKRAPRRFTPMTEINVTPFVDVMLVLLIVFMVTAPLLTAGVELKLPKTDAKALPAEAAPLTLSITTDGRIFIGGGKDGEEIPYEELTPKLRAISQAREEGEALRIYLRADEATAYGAVIKVMARVRNAGFANIALVTDPIPEPAG